MSPSGGPVATWTDKVTVPKNLTAAAGVNQPTLDASTMGGQSLLFDDVNDQVQAASAADWKFLHEGTGQTVVVRCRPTGTANDVLIDTMNASAANRGFMIFYDGTNQRWVCQIGDGAGNAIVSINQASGGSPRNRDCTIVFRYLEGRGGNEYSFRFNGVELFSGNSTGAPGTGNPAGPLSVGSMASGPTGLPFKGYVKEIVMSTSYETDANVVRLEDYIGGTGWVVFDGNSMTDGAASTYPAGTITLLNKAAVSRNVGVSGQTISQMLSDVTTDVDAYFRAQNPFSICAFWEGRNAIANAQTDVQVYNNYVTYGAGRRAQGFRVIAITIPPSLYGGGNDALFETRRLSANAMMRANASTFCDRLIDLENDIPLLGAPGANANVTYYNVDQVHPNSTGYALLSTAVAAVINGWTG